MPNSQVKSLVLGGTTYDLVDETSTFSTIAGAHDVITNATGSISIKIPTTAAHVGAAASDHTHTTTLATDTGTSSITLASAGKYKLTAGGTSVIFTMPTIPTVNYPVTSVNTKTGAVVLSASDVGALASDTTYVSKITTTAGAHTAITNQSGAVSFNVPTNISHLTNDSGFVTTDEKLKTTALSSGTSYLIMGSTSGTAETKLHSTHLSFTSTRTFSIGSSGNKGTLRLYSSTSSSYTDLSNSATAARTITIPDATGTLALTSDIPTIPTNVSAFTNDAGYLTSYTETDPTVPSWAKASTKPTYTASEVGAAATSHAHGNITSGGDITATAPTIANGDQIVINDSSASKITNGPTFDGSTTNKYLSPKGTWESLPQGTAYTAGTGLSLSGTEFNHSNSVTATETAGVYPIEIDAQGHISYYGDAVNIDNFVENYNGENISGYIATVTSDGCGVLRYRDQRFSEDNTAQIQYGTASNNTSSFISLDANDINIWGNINAESNKIINLGTPTASTDAATKDYVDSNIPTKTSDLTNDSGFVTTDEKLAISDINVNNTYYPILATNSTAAATRQYDNIGFEYRAFNGTAGDHSSGGNATLTLGNNKTHQTYKWKQGVLRLYGIGAYYVELKGDPTANRTITIPNATGTLALTSDLSGFLSSASLSGTYNSTTKDLTLSITTS